MTVVVEKVAAYTETHVTVANIAALFCRRSMRNAAEVQAEVEGAAAAARVVGCAR